MTKQECIQQAYGESYEMLKNFIDSNNGQCEVYSVAHGKTNGAEPDKYRFKQDCYSIVHYGGAGYHWIPNALLGIETNNGWTKIESESDLPEEGEFRVFPFGRIENVIFTADGVGACYRNGRISHFKPLKEEPNPLY